MTVSYARAWQKIGVFYGLTLILSIPFWYLLAHAAVGLISGSLWAIWHYPLMFYGGYNASIPAWYAAGCFTVMLVAAGFIAAFVVWRKRGEFGGG
jgi:hypothetical protein